MALEALLAYAHILAIPTMLVFLASEATLCQVASMNAAVVQRLRRVDLIHAVAATLTRTLKISPCF